VSSALARLDKRDYEIIYECILITLRYNALSRKLGVARSTVRYRRDKALKHLRQIIMIMNDEKL